MAISTDSYWLASLDEEAAARCDQPSFHVFAEGMHSDARGQIFNVDSGGLVALSSENAPRRLFIVIGVTGSLEAQLCGQTIRLRPLSQLVVLPGVPCRIRATSRASFEVLSFVSAVAQPVGSAGSEDR